MTAVQLFDVSLRDGLQNEAVVVPTHQKLAIAQRLVDAGYTDIELTSFVRPRLVPQLADASDVVAGLRGLHGADDVRFWALVPNQIGLDRAVDSGIGHICTFMSASETHNQKNVNRTIRESQAALERVIRSASTQEIGTRAYISTVFGCPFEGDVAVGSTLGIGKALLDAGADVIVLGDTTGMATPHQVKDVLAALVDGGIPLDRIGLHFHDTRGTAVVNAFAAWQFGARMFDGSTAGVGGCPYAPGATGNAASEDLVYLFDSIGDPSGVDLELACEAGRELEDVLGRELPGRYHRYWLAETGRAKCRTTA
ncbi:MAG: hydroxymethylglutaryl-CoA lyase [Myxococcales bacterium]|nr:hydroxymethylglutaryl-CoA lyase [Myxococcales bacterium]